MGMPRLCCGASAGGGDDDEDDAAAAVEASIEARNSAVVTIGGLEAVARRRGTGLLIHPSLILTTHSTIPDPACLRHAQLTLCRSSSPSDFVTRRLTPYLFFRTDPQLDLTLVSCELVESDVATPLPVHDDNNSAVKSKRHRRHIFVMGCLAKRPEEIALARGIELRSGGATTPHSRRNSFVRFTAGADLWMPGSAGFDESGAFAFLVSKPDIKQDNGDDVRQKRELRPAQWGTCILAIRRWIQPQWLQEVAFPHHFRPAAKDQQHHSATGAAHWQPEASGEHQDEVPVTSMIRHAGVGTLTHSRSDGGADPRPDGHHKEDDADQKAKNQTNKNTQRKNGTQSVDISVQTDGDLRGSRTDFAENVPISVRPIAASAESRGRRCSYGERVLKARGGEGGGKRRRERWSIGSTGGAALQDLQMNVVNGIRAARQIRSASLGRTRSAASSRASTPTIRPRRRRSSQEVWEAVAAIAEARPVRSSTDHVAYSKPTISYMRKMSMERRRDSEARRRTPRWM